MKFNFEDQEIINLIKEEEIRQNSELNMIPSENLCSENILKALGSNLNNKYSEGYPNKRYYQGNRIIDQIETIAIERAKQLFNVEHVNVQPHSGSSANMAVYFSVLKNQDKILGMNLSSGGHLTHGSKVNFSGREYNFISYDVDKESNLLDYEEIRKIALKEKPKMIVCGYTAYPRKIDFKKFKEIADEVGAFLLADISHIAGLIAGKAHESPVPYADFITTTTHKTLRGPRSAIIMCKKQYAKEIDKAIFPGLQGGPHEHVIAAKAIAFKEATTKEFQEYAQQIVSNAKILAKTLMENNVKLVTNGTDNHLILIDLIKTPFINEIGVGKKYAIALEEAGIITNANTVPFDPSTPFKPSGIRLGTPFLTTQGLKEKEMIEIGNLITKVLKNPEKAKEIKKETENIMKNI